MVAIKRAGVKSREVKTGFESYDGAEPTRSGMYRAKIVACKYKRFKENSDGVQNEGLVVSVVLEAQKGDPKKHAEFDGWPKTTNVVFMDKEQMIAREENFYAALGVKDEPTINMEKGDIEKGVKVTNIAGKNPVGVFVNVDLKPDRDTTRGLTIDGIYKFKEGTTKFVASEDADEDEDDLLDEAEEQDLDAMSLVELRALAKEYGIKTVGLKKPDLIDAITDAQADEDEAEDEEDEAEEEEGGEYDERAEELAGMSIPDLREILKELGGKTTGLKKDGLVEAILDLEFEEESDEDEDEDDEDETDEEDDDDEEDEESYDEVARRKELKKLDRAGLRKVLQSLQPDATTKKSESDADIVDRIVAIENTPF